MLHKETLIQEIRKGLAVLQFYIRPGGRLNLSDTNVHAEDFVAGLLNAIFDWTLVNKNQLTSNYPCIDLFDESQSLGIQVTAEKRSQKLAQTIECLKQHNTDGKVRKLKFFSLIQKQSRYTVNVDCPGVEFDCKTDVLDFDDAVKFATGIADLKRLERVHQHVVSAMPTVFPDRSAYAPRLYIPATDPAASWLAFSSRSTKLIGREDDCAKLSTFLASPSKFSWWLMTGIAGSGKSRIALELCWQSVPEWHAGFLSRTENEFNWERFVPTQKTLIIIDYVASRASEASDTVLKLARRSPSFEWPVRVLLLERDTESWWADFNRSDSQSESAEIGACLHQPSFAISDLAPTAILGLAEEVVRARNGKWDRATAFEFLSRLHHYDGRGRPLYAMILAELLDTISSDATTPDLLKDILQKESGRRRRLIDDSTKLMKMENLMFLSTLVSGLLPTASGFDYLAASDIAELIPNVNFLDETLYDNFTGARRGSTSLMGLQPDILGESFVLDRLCSGGIAGVNAKRLLRAAWSFQPKDVRVVGIRLAHDFPDDEGLFQLFDLPHNSSQERVIWADMVADMIAAMRRVEDRFSQEQLQKLIYLADRFTNESKLQAAAARADYNMGCNMLFTKMGNPEERFNAVVARAGADSQIGLMAILNLGILNDDDKEKSIQTWTTVIQSRRASNEIRACALNNRANVHVDRADHESAIVDRSSVISLEGTSADRRFVALFRRSESYAALNNFQAAFDDLSRILETSDIPSFEKLLAKLERAVILNSMQRSNDAHKDLENALSSRLFSSEPLDRVMNAESARKAGDFEKANEYLCEAVAEQEKRGKPDIRILIVGAMLLDDQGFDAHETQVIWSQLSDAIRNNANRIRIARPRLEETAD